MDPPDAIFLITVVGPVSLVLAKLGIPAFTWRRVWLLTPVVSWLVVNYELWMVPPDNGMAYGIAFWLGWLWLLPVTAFLWLLQALLFLMLPRLRGSQAFQRACRRGAKLALALIVALVLFGTFGWISSDRAIQIATRHLSRQEHAPSGAPHAVWSWSNWTVRFGDDSGPFVNVSRTGALMGGGG